jgi:hypothetical protein
MKNGLSTNYTDCLFSSAETWQRFVSGDLAPPSISGICLAITALSGEPGLAKIKRCRVIALNRRVKLVAAKKIQGRLV